MEQEGYDEDFGYHDVTERARGAIDTPRHCVAAATHYLDHLVSGSFARVSHLSAFDGTMRSFCDCGYGRYLEEVLRQTRPEEDLVGVRELRCVECLDF